VRRAAALALGFAALGAAPAHAFDCAKAASASEKAICADPAALAADADLGKAFEALRAAADPKTRAGLAAAEVAWLRRRDGDCSDQKGPALGACLASQSRVRFAFLTGAPQAGPGTPGRLAPVFRMQKGAKGRADIDIQRLNFVDPATPAQRAFNAAVDKLSDDVQEPEKDDPAADRYAFVLSMRLAYASPRLISAHAEGYSDTGGAHPNSFTANVNIDVAQGREAAFDALLDKPGAQKVFALCLKQVRDQKHEREGEDEQTDADSLKSLADNVAQSSADLKAWSFGAESATLTYDPYAVGAYAEGAFQCVIPYATLRPLAKPGFPLPE
jgi:uncharacterized protein YecT (DUF1311 family)